MKGHDLAPLKTKYSSSAPINKGGFHGLSTKKSEAKIGQKTSLSPVFFSPSSPLFFLPFFAMSLPPLPSPVTCWATQHHQERCWPLFQLGKPSPLSLCSSFSHTPPRQLLHAKFVCSGGLINLHSGLDSFLPNSCGCVGPLPKKKKGLLGCQSAHTDLVGLDSCRPSPDS